MLKQPDKSSPLRSSASQERVEAATQERRLASRYALVVTAEAEELTAGIKLPARISDLSVFGCYLDTLNPFSSGTRIRIHLSKGNETFESLALVVYSHDGMGMGVSFTDINPAAQETIQKWLAESSGGEPFYVPSNSNQNPIPEARDSSAKAGQIERLVQILVKKGLLTQEEAHGILG